MLTYKECVELREKLVNQEISLEVAEEIYKKDYQEGKRSWDTKDWKDRRVKFLKNKCEKCNSTDILTIQHLSHPKKYSEFKREVIRKYTKILQQSHSNIDKEEYKDYIIKNYDYIPVPL